jgi:hypothetical protein
MEAEHKTFLDISVELDELEEQYPEGDVWENDEELFRRARVYALTKSLLVCALKQADSGETVEVDKCHQLLVRIDRLTDGW